MPQDVRADGKLTQGFLKAAGQGQQAAPMLVDQGWICHMNRLVFAKSRLYTGIALWCLPHLEAGQRQPVLPRACKDLAQAQPRGSMAAAMLQRLYEARHCRRMS